MDTHAAAVERVMAREGHALVGIGDLPADGYTAVCSCGWESAVSLGNTLPRRWWEGHSLRAAITQELEATETRARRQALEDAADAIEKGDSLTAMDAILVIERLLAELEEA